MKAKEQIAKQRALEALIASTSIRQASQTAGVSERSIYSWLRNDQEFLTAYQDLRAESLQAVADKVGEKTAEAIEVLSSIMSDENERGSTRIRASQIILETHLRLTEIIDFEQRLRAVEDKLK